jgi:hypothetical protein
VTGGGSLDELAVAERTGVCGVRTGVAPRMLVTTVVLLTSAIFHFFSPQEQISEHLITKCMRVCETINLWHRRGHTEVL